MDAGVPEHLFVAEKPSLAEAIARAHASQVGATAAKSDGYWAVGNDKVTWLRGHFYELAKPEEYDDRLKRWSLDDLPIIPERWKLVPRGEAGVRQQLGTVRRLLKEASAGAGIIVNAGDAAREGQLLVDEVLQEAGVDPFSPAVKRLWVKSMADKDMAEALRAIFPNADKQNLFKSAVCRQRADWAHGMNMSRLFTILARKGGSDALITVGRVQTPTLKLVVDRDREIENFKPVDHFIPKIKFQHAGGTFEAAWVVPADHPGLDPEGYLIDKKAAEVVAAKVDGRTGAVDAFASQPKSKAPPLPFNLSALQKLCSARFGLTAQETLDVAQSLYEKHKVATYPRSDSQYLPTAILTDEAPQIMKAIAGTEELGRHAQAADMRLRSPAWNDEKVSDHHGIIPTAEFTPAKLNAMSEVERKVFLAIARSFVAQFYPDRTWDAQSVQVSCEGEKFKANGTVEKEPGWTVLYDKDDEEDDEEKSAGLPKMARGDPVKAVGSRVEAKRTQPPKRFTDGTLIDAMTQIHRFVRDPEVKKKLKESSGIGTQATRAAIIENLLYRKFFRREKKKFILSTPVGRDIIDALPQEIADPGLTALWEDALGRVELGEVSIEKFMEAQTRSIAKRIEEAKARGVTVRSAKPQREIKPVEGHGEACPQCGKGKLVTRVVFSGPSKGSSFLACDTWNKDDKTSCDYRAWAKKAPVEPLPEDGKPCPSCGQGKLITRMVQSGDSKGKRFLACDAWRKDDPASCKYTAWPQEERPKVEPLPGDGAQCQKCGKGTMRTRVAKASGKRFLACDNWKKDDKQQSCSNSIWPEDSTAKIPGEGAQCPKCKVGHMRTRRSKAGDLFLACDNWTRESPKCSHMDWSAANEKKPRKASSSGAGRGGSSRLPKPVPR